MITYSRPLYMGKGESRRFAGVLTADISLEWLEKIVSPIKVFKSGYVFMISSNGTFITHPQREYIMKKTIFDIARETQDTNLERIGRVMTSGERGLAANWSPVTGEKAFLYYLPLPQYGWSLGVLCAQEELLSGVKDLTHMMFFLCFVGFGIFLWILVICAGSIIRTSFFTRITPAILPQNYRSFVVLNAGTVFAVCIHMTVLPLFILTGALVIVAFNAVSISSYLLALRLNRGGHHLATVSICVVELIIHQTLCVMYLGLGTGFQYYLLAVPGIIFFLPPGHYRSKFVLLAGTALAFVGLLHMPGTSTTTIPLNASLVSAINDFNMLVVFGMLGFFVYFYAKAADVAEMHLDRERKKVEELLHAILPAPIARRLRDRREIIADGFTSTTVLFADIVNFTPISARLTPAEIVELLDEVFSEFDGLVDRFGLEKIKTIGDAYMVAAGVPEPMENHASAAVRLALEMQKVIAGREPVGGSRLELRIGIHSGPVVAGVIGKRKFSYDLWGDTVNTASRMESHGMPGEIQISGETRQGLGDGFILEERGQIEIKGKGLMRTWLVKGEKQ
jgi:class 3 adenylate cyclase